MARKKETARTPVTNIRREQVLAKCEGKCCHCGVELRLGDNFSIEHVIPLNKGGNNDFKNIVALCKDCNFEKGDDVVDADFYEYTPRIVKEEIEELLNGYYENNDWLTATNIFKHDRFSIEVTRSIHSKGKTFYKTAKCEIKKVQEDEYWEFIDKIPKEELEVVEAVETSTTKQAIEGSMYKVVFNGRTSMMFFVALSAGTGKGNQIDGRAMLRIIVSVSPEIVWGISAKSMTCDIINGILNEFCKSMDAQSTKGLIMVCVDASAEDKRAVELIKAMTETPELMVNPENSTLAFYRTSLIMGFGVETETTEDGQITLEEFVKKEKLYSGQLRRRIAQNS